MGRGVRGSAAKCMSGQVVKKESWQPRDLKFWEEESPSKGRQHQRYWEIKVIPASDGCHWLKMPIPTPYTGIFAETELVAGVSLNTNLWCQVPLFEKATVLICSSWSSLRDETLHNTTLKGLECFRYLCRISLRFTLSQDWREQHQHHHLSVIKQRLERLYPAPRRLHSAVRYVSFSVDISFTVPHSSDTWSLIVSSIFIS